jgi:hypothetical protein
MNEEMNNGKKKGGFWKRFFANIGFGILFGVCAGIAFFGVKLVYEIAPVDELLVMSGLKENSTSSNNGDNYFDININVESISDDYDVEQMAEKIKEIIYEDSMYRNVNNINQIR